MSTSLAEQLKKLAVPQTSILIQGKARPSLLFDPREAAKFDRDTFYETGVSGLVELIKLNPRFEEFHRNLFDPTSRSLERSVEDKKTNKTLNKHIRRFLLMLSPYFLLKASHKALEWLVNRFHIESFNVDDIMSLILPYHDTRIFVRVLQMMDISDPANKWHWLYPLQGAGVPLSKTALLNRCATDASFLHFICKITSDTIKEYKNKEGSVSTLLAFHCTTIVGGLEHVNRVNELQMTYLLKSLFRGLTSPLEDFVAASYMIVAQLIRRTQLSPQIFYGIVNKVAECNHPKLHSECVLLLVLLYQSQHPEKVPSVSAHTVIQLAHHSWFPAVLAQLQDTGIHIIPFFIPLLRSTLSAIQSQMDDRTDLCNFAERLLEVVDENVAQLTIQTTIETFDVDGLTARRSENEENVNIGIDDAEEVISWYAGFLKSLERRHANSYDAVIRKALGKEDDSSAVAKAVKTLLGVAGSATSLSGTDLFERIHHPNAAVRVEAVRYLVENYNCMQERDKELTCTAVTARLQDDNVKVVRMTLGLHTEVLVELLGAETALDELLSLAINYVDKSSKGCSEVVRLVVQHLCTDLLCNNSALAQTRILLALLPFLMPLKENELGAMIAIVKQHSFVNNCKFLAALIKELYTKGSADTCSVFLHCLSESRELLPDVDLLLQAAEKIYPANRKPIHMMLLLLMMASAVAKQPTPALSQQILDMAVSYFEKCQVARVNGDMLLMDGNVMADCMRAARSGRFPLVVYLHVVSQLVQHTPLFDVSKCEKDSWWDLDHCDKTDSGQRLNFVVRVLEVLLAGCGVPYNEVRMQHAICLKQFFQMYFPTPALQVKFLCNVIAYPGSERGAVGWPELRLRCLHLVVSLLRQSDDSISWALHLEEPVVPALLTAAANPLAAIRHAALDCLITLASSIGAGLDSETYLQLLEAIKDRREEIMLDPDQLSLVLYTVLSPDPAVKSLLKPSQHPQLAAALKALLSCITSVKTPAYITVGLLDLLASVNSQEIFNELLPLGIHILTRGKESDGHLDSDSSAIIHNIVQRLTCDTAACLKYLDCWKFVQTAITDWKVVLQDRGGKTCPAIIMMQQITRELFEVVEEPLQRQLLTHLVIAATDSELPEVASAAGRVVKKIVLDSKLVAEKLEQMSSAELKQQPVVSPGGMVLRSRRKVNKTPSPELLKTEEWRYGITLLEWVQSKKKLRSTHLLLSPLFSVLNKCLEFDEQPPVEYSKQLVLSCLLHCCQKLSHDSASVDAVVKQALNVESVVHCIRASQNPHTHHHALLLLAHVAGMMPEQVLHNIMAIFTFMGSSILRQDDAYSFQVISKIVDTVIPILVKASESTVERSTDIDGAVCAVLRVFADTVLHIPEHRRLVLFHKILTTLGPEQSLWLFLCLVLEEHVIHSQEEKMLARQQDWGELPPRQEFALNLARSFPPFTVIVTCIKLVKYVQCLPIEKEESTKHSRVHKSMSSTLALKFVPVLFNVELHSAKQLRHFRFTICTYVSSLLSSAPFVNQVAALGDETTQKMEPLYQELIENILTYIQAVNVQHDRREQQTAKYWTVMLGLAYDVLDKVNALLPSNMFLLVIRGLLNHKLPTVRRKAMELLNTRLQHQGSFFSSCNHEALYSLLTPLLSVMGSIGGDTVKPDLETNQQVAMLSVKLLARHLAPENPSQFKQILERVTELVQSDAVQKNLLASVVLCLAELVSVLRAHAIGMLSQFMPAVIKVLREQQELESPNLVLLSIVTATLKIVESLPHFLSPYLDKLLLEVSIQSAKWQHISDDSKVTPVVHKLKAIRQKLSSTVPGRVLTPAVSQCYARLLARCQYSALGPLLSVLADSFSTLSRSELTQLVPDLTAFFMSALQFRADCSTGGSEGVVSQDDIERAEGYVVEALVVLILKLSESTFRPLYYTLFHWATSSEAHKDRVITFYRLSSSIAESLKGLFVLFAGRLVQNASTLLNHTNVCKSGDCETEEQVYEEASAQLLLQYVLQTLYRVFQHDSGQGFVNKERFDALMQPLVDQLENTLGGVEALQLRVSSLLAPCLSQFAVAVADDALWKQLNYQVLLKARHNLPQVRLASLEVLCEMARKLGEDFLPLLPETVPFLAELLEDEEEAVETACQKAVQNLEEILGEPLKKYF